MFWLAWHICESGVHRVTGFQTLTFENCDLPLNAVDVSFSLVFKGNLGFERNSVAFGYKKISEPTPLSVFNNTDLICYNASYVPADSPELIAAMDKNGDGVILCLDGEETVSPLNAYLTRFSFDGMNAWESPSEHQISYEPAILIPPNSMYTIYILANTESFNTSHVVWAWDPNDINCMYDYKKETSEWAINFSNYLILEFINNQWTLRNRRSGIGSFRGRNRFNISVLTHSIPPDATCNASTFAGADVNDDVTSKNEAGAVILQKAVKASADDFKKKNK